MSKLSKREILLLYLLLVVLAVAAGWFLIRPALDDGAVLDEAVNVAELQKSSVEQSIQTRPIHAESIAASEARIEELEEEFLPVMTNDDLDRYITGLLQRNLLIAESLLISNSSIAPVNLAVTNLFVKVAATGELPQFMSLVDQLSRLKGIRIASLIVREKGLKTLLVPLTAEEIAELEAASAGKKPVAAEGEMPVKEVTVMEYHMDIGFEVSELDPVLFAAMVG